jgi:steroid 5-alpha reductase family enzyme
MSGGTRRNSRSFGLRKVSSALDKVRDVYSATQLQPSNSTATWITFVSLPVLLVRILISFHFTAVLTLVLWAVHHEKVNSLPVSAHRPIGLRDILGLALWASSFAFEVVAGTQQTRLHEVLLAIYTPILDSQKSSWRQAKAKKKHSEEFITSGLWSLSRHPK